MSFDKLKNLFSRTFEKEEDSLLAQAQNFISSSRRTIVENPTAEFENYLQGLPTEQLKLLRTAKPRSQRTASLRPQLVKRCYENVPKDYFSPAYSVSTDIFTRSRNDGQQRTMKMQQYLDEVELCLFNQISSRFDQILSVLRTIESLECIVVSNAQRLAQVRSGNMQLTQQVSKRQLRITALLKRQRNIEATLARLTPLRDYAAFLQTDPSSLKLTRSHSHHQKAITHIRTQAPLLIHLNATMGLDQRLDDFESSLRRSYADAVNDALFSYATDPLPYDPNWWERKFAGRVVLEEEQPEGEVTVVLDESVLEQEQGSSGVALGLNAEREAAIVQELVGGWRQADYSISHLKAAFERFCKERHLRFLHDLRNYCFQTAQREGRRVENPSLGNLLQIMTVSFCVKTFTAYTDHFRPLLARSLSFLNTALTALTNQPTPPLTIEEKERLTAACEGLTAIGSFLLKLIYQKVIELVELRPAHDAMQLGDFRLLAGVLQSEEQFLERVRGAWGGEEWGLVRRAKEAKVLGWLGKTHRFVVESELRESFENEVWVATDIPTFYYDSLHFLITGETLNLRRNKGQSLRNTASRIESSVFFDRLPLHEPPPQSALAHFRIIRSEITIGPRVYRVTQTLLLLLEILQDYLLLGQAFPCAQKEAGAKAAQLLRAYCGSSAQLIILGGAVKLGRIKTKTITAKHLALHALCLSFLLFLLQCLGDRLDLPDPNKTRADIEGHHQTALKKLQSVLGGKIKQALADIGLTSTPSKGTQSIVNNTKNLHDILADYFQKDTLARVFTSEQTKTYLDRLRTLPVTTKGQAEALKEDLHFYFTELAFLETVVEGFAGLRLAGEELLRNKFEEL